MPDIMSKEERSKRMSLIRSEWTKPERFVHNFLKGNKVKHKMHPKITGSPDIIIPEKKIAIFIHGCFWHGCKKCYNPPSTNKAFWKNKLEKNMLKDKKDKKDTNHEGWKHIVIWEHEIPRNNPGKGIRNILKNLNLV